MQRVMSTQQMGGGEQDGDIIARKGQASAEASFADRS